ncbi:kinase-like protein [Aspergillus violaceofuscus CBS 115571]|uniref:non-specific serine/threonine protein kinase n=1 Tax=Aspergillus violaceofuscus (strain CBS 115571) TaxID=1450538 RepID=A0A2V5H9E5_ASPV1|nr:kinase-like protein [Aspergillus violaceofuscus CBS 115571]
MSPLHRLTLNSRRTMFAFAKKSLWQLPPHPGPTIPRQEPVDEELCPDYDSATYYPAKPGEILEQRFQLLSKIGWGSQSTVWLARDIPKFRWQPEETVALKIINSNDGDSALHEREIEKHVSQQNPEHRWGVILRTCLDDFEIPGPQGKHMCLKRFVDRKLPLPIAKAYIYFLLVGLDSLHSECKVVHTDLKLENILLSFENENILTNFVKRQQPRQYKIDGESGRTIYRCCNDFGPLDAKEIKNMVPKISDFGLATRLDELPSYDGMVGSNWTFTPFNQITVLPR